MEAIMSYIDFTVYFDPDTQKLYEHDNETGVLTEVEEVFIFEGDYEDIPVESMESMVQASGIDYDFCGELDDRSAYVFYKEIEN